MKKVFVCVALLAVTGTVVAQVKTKPKPVVKQPVKGGTKSIAIKTSLDSMAYAIGVNIAGSLQQQGLDKISTSLLQKGLDDALTNKKMTIDPQQCNAIIQNYMQGMQQKAQMEAMQQASVEKVKSAAFLDSNRKRPGVITLPNGLQYEVLVKGNDSSAMAKATDTVVVHYAGTLINGLEFDNSYKRGEPLVRWLTGVIPGWTQILQMMHIGDKWKVFVPSDLGYGDRGAGSGAIPGGAALIFEMELLGIKPVATN